MFERQDNWSSATFWFEPMDCTQDIIDKANRLLIMYKYLIPVLAIILLAGCETFDTRKINKDLLNCTVEYLNFTDNFLFENQVVNYDPQEPYNKIYFKYENNTITRVTGGVRYLPGGTSLYGDLIFSNESYDSIIYCSDSILVYTLPELYFLFFDNPKNPIIYLIDSNDRLVKIIRRDGLELTYEYADNIITEKSNDERKTRRFYLENMNLQKVETLMTDNKGMVVRRKEILFKDYDGNPNPFYSKYYILGAFYRAFSRNNYETYTINEYALEDNEFTLKGSFTFSMPISYTRNGYPAFGDYE